MRRRIPYLIAAALPLAGCATIGSPHPTPSDDECAVFTAVLMSGGPYMPRRVFSLTEPSYLPELNDWGALGPALPTIDIRECTLLKASPGSGRQWVNRRGFWPIDGYAFTRPVFSGDIAIVDFGDAVTGARYHLRRELTGRWTITSRREWAIMID